MQGDRQRPQHPRDSEAPVSAAIIRSTPSGISVSRVITRESSNDLPSVVADLVAPFRDVHDAMAFSSGVPMEPSVAAVVAAYPQLLDLLQGELAQYIRAYADKCSQLEDQVCSLRLHVCRLMSARVGR